MRLGTWLLLTGLFVLFWSCNSAATGSASADGGLFSFPLSLVLFGFSGWLLGFSVDCVTAAELGPTAAICVLVEFLLERFARARVDLGFDLVLVGLEATFIALELPVALEVDMEGSDASPVIAAFRAADASSASFCARASFSSMLRNGVSSSSEPSSSFSSAASASGSSGPSL